MNEQVWWFLARATGIVAWVFLTAAVVWGIVAATDLFPRRRRPAWLVDLHRWLGGLTVGFAVGHIAALWADSWIEFGLVDFVIPLASEWKPVPVAFGVLAMWGLVVVQGTSLAMRRLPRRIWRTIHLVSYVTFWLTTLHGTYAGTDATKPIYLISSTIAILAVVFLAVFRALGRQRRAAPGGRGQTAGRARAEGIGASI